MNNNKSIETMGRIMSAIEPATKALYTFEKKVSTAINEQHNYVEMQIIVNAAKEELISSIITLAMTMITDERSRKEVIAFTMMMKPWLNELLDMEAEIMHAAIMKSNGAIDEADQVLDYSCDRVVNSMISSMQSLIDIAKEADKSREINMNTARYQAENNLYEEIMHAAGNRKTISIEEIDKIVQAHNKINLAQ